MAFYDQPDLIRDMVRFWTDFIRDLLECALRYVTPDLIHISEDMAYKSFSMISPAMVREFLLPCYRAWGEIVRAHGVPLYGVDSDGYTGELIPIWIEAGINLHDSIEVAAGNDLVAYHRRFGRAMAYQGGVDKRAIAKGGSAIRAELERLTPVIRGGGYIPGCDHGVPPDVSWSASKVAGERPETGFPGQPIRRVGGPLRIRSLFRAVLPFRAPPSAVCF